LNKFKIVFIPVILTALFAAGLVGCGQTTTTPALPEPDYAHAITETTLKGLSDDSLEEYTRYGNADFKAAVTQDILDKTAAQVNSQLGAYESLAYVSTETQDRYTVVHYKAKYAKGEVGVRMVFDQDHLVVGQWFE
jgi:hypothetical protein